MSNYFDTEELPKEGEFFKIPDADYTPIKGGGSLGGWMNENFKEAKAKQSYFTMDEDGVLKTPNPSDVDIDFFDPSGAVGMVGSTAVKFGYSSAKALAKLSPKAKMSKKQVESYMLKQGVPEAQVKMLKLPDGELPVKDWLVHADNGGHKVFNEQNAYGTEQHRGVIMDGSDMNTYKITSQHMDTDVIPGEGIAPKNHWDDVSNIGHTRGTVEEVEGIGKVQMFQEGQSDFAQSTRTLGSKTINNSQMKVDYNKQIKKAREEQSALTEQVDIDKAEKKIAKLRDMQKRQDAVIASPMVEDLTTKLKVNEAKSYELETKLDDLQKEFDDIYFYKHKDYKELQELKQASQNADLAKEELVEELGVDVISTKEFRDWTLKSTDATRAAQALQRSIKRSMPKFSDYKNVGELKSQYTKTMQGYDDIAMQLRDLPGATDGTLIKDFPINAPKFRQHQIMTEVEHMLDNGIDTLAIPLDRSGALLGDDVTAAYYRDVPKDFAAIKKQLEKQGHKVTVNKQDYSKKIPIRKVFAEDYAAIDRDFRRLDWDDNVPGGVFEANKILDRSFESGKIDLEALADTEKWLKHVEASSEVKKTILAKIELLRTASKNDKVKKINEIMTLKIEKAEGVDIDWTVWGVGGVAVGLGATQESEGL